MQRTILPQILLSIAGLEFSPQAYAQARPIYRVVPLPVSSYSSEALDGSRLKIAPKPSQPLLWLALVSSEVSPLKDGAGYARQDVDVLAVYSAQVVSTRKTNTIESDDSYLGGAGSVFPVSNTMHLSVLFSTIALDLDLVLKDGRMFITGATYQASCGAETGFAELKHLKKWLAQIEAGIEIPKNGYLELDLPNPLAREPLAPGEKDWRERFQCSLGSRVPIYFDFEVRPVDPDARVYLGGKYLGTAGPTFRISTNPADILIRKDGHPDIAKRIYFHDGPNYLEVSFPPSIGKGAK